MQISSDSYLMWTGAFFYFIAAIRLIYKIKKEGITILYPISFYLVGIGTFFTFMGLFALLQVNIIALLAALSIVIGASTMARFPLKLEWAGKEKPIYIFLLIISVILVSYGFITDNVPLMMKLAHYYALIVAGLFTMGYILYTGIKSPQVRVQSFSTGGSLGLCCVMAHAAAAIPLFPLFGLSFFGLATLSLPIIFALLSPVAFIYVIILDKLIKPASQ